MTVAVPAVRRMAGYPFPEGGHLCGGKPTAAPPDHCPRCDAEEVKRVAEYLVTHFDDFVNQPSDMRRATVTAYAAAFTARTVPLLRSAEIIQKRVDELCRSSEAEGADDG